MPAWCANVASPDEYLQEPFNSGNQRDAQEFLGQLLQTDEDQDVHSKLMGLCRPRMRCVRCGCSRDAANADAFFLLPLPLSKPGSPVVRSIQVAVDRYFEEEVLPGFKRSRHRQDTTLRDRSEGLGHTSDEIGKGQEARASRRG